MMVANATRFGTEKALEPLKRGNAAGTHLLGPINQVLDLSKIEASKLELNPESVNLAPLIDEVIGSQGGSNFDTNCLHCRRRRTALVGLSHCRTRLQLERVSIKSPIQHMAVALISVFSSLQRSLGIFRVPNFYRILQAFKWMPVRAKEILEKSDTILGIRR
jgi:hypothetical protein